MKKSELRELIREEISQILGTEPMPVDPSKLRNVTKPMPIDPDKLKNYASSIRTCCNGEYGDVYHNEDENHIFVCLGDSSPFDPEQLEWYIKSAIAKDFRLEDLIKVTIENEATPGKGNWKKFNGKEFVECEE